MSLVLTSLLVWMGLLSPVPPPHPQALAPKALAVLDFDNNSGDSRYDPLGKGVASMMISDLSSVPSIQVVERQRLQDLMREMDLQRSRYFDPSTAQQLGQMVGAEYVLVGSLVAMQPKIRIDTRVVRVATGEVVKTAEVTGREDHLFELQQKLADALIEGLEIALSPEDRERLLAQQEANRIESVETALAYSEALSLFDREDYFGAAEKMAGVMRAAPRSALVALTYQEMKTRAARAAKQKTRNSLKKFLRDRIPR